jgi:ABC-2 type transport system ATP-binding protein
MRHLTPTALTAELGGVPAGLDGHAGVHEVVVEELPGGGARLRCQVDAAALDDVLRRCTDAGVRSLVSRPPTLEELFLRHYSEPEPAGDRPRPRP